MELIAAILCDHVSVREGLAMIVGGGITRIHRASMPAPITVQLAVMIQMSPPDHRSDHELAVELNDADGHQVVRAQAAFTVHPRNLDPGESNIVSIGVGFPAEAKLPAYGRYAVEIALDGVHVRSLSFKVQRPPQPT